MVRLPIGQPADGRPAYTLYLALSIDFHSHYISDLENKPTVTASLISMMIILIVLFTVHKGHEPVRNISRRIRNITSKDLDVRLDPQTVPIESEQLVSSFNHMIERIEDIFKHQSDFSAGITHKIRTPITNLVTQTETTLNQTRSRKEPEDVLYSNLEEFSRMSKIVSGMLFLTQAGNDQLTPKKRALNLADEVDEIFDFFEVQVKEREIGLRFEGRACWIPDNPLMLYWVTGNLPSNAIHYTSESESVIVRVKEAGGQVQVVVGNPGDPTPPQHLPRLLNRFYRADPLRQRKGGGGGIGLTIAKSIVTVYREKVSATSNPYATRFILTLSKHTI